MIAIGESQHGKKANTKMKETLRKKQYGVGKAGREDIFGRLLGTVGGVH